MKNIILLLLAIFCFACNSDSNDDSANTTSTPIDIPANPTVATAPGEAPGQAFVPAGADGIVHHYICPDRCAGGVAEGGGACPVCGKTLEHNKAFHGQAAGGSTPAGGADNGGINITNADGTPFGGAAQTQIPQEPAQNAKGVWHYTCPSGCAGGGGGAAACGKCGETLAHNAEYHK